MKTHEFTVYPNHIDFLKDFPDLRTWLNANGFSLLHSHNDFRTHLVHTFWDDHTAVAEKEGVSDAENSLMITYCRLCKTVNVYHRDIVADAHNEKSLISQLDQRVFGKRIDESADVEPEEEPFVEFPTPAQISTWISDLEQQ